MIYYNQIEVGHPKRWETPCKNNAKTNDPILILILINIILHVPYHYTYGFGKHA